MHLYRYIVVLFFVLSTMNESLYSITDDLYRQIKASLPTLPTFRQLSNEGKVNVSHRAFIDEESYPNYSLVPLRTLEELLDSFFTMMNGYLDREKSWYGSTAKLQQLIQPGNSAFLPYAQKEIVDPHTAIICKGDLHGDLHSLMAFIEQLEEFGWTQPPEPLKIIHPRARLLFLGDYVDRGIWGVEVISLLMLLKLHNPDKVFLIRGNHEDVLMTSRFGFTREFFSKYAREKKSTKNCVFEKIAQFYEYLPSVFYLGCGSSPISFLQCCHGGMEMGYNPKELLASEKSFQFIEGCNRMKECSALPDIPITMGYGNSCPIKEAFTDFIPLSPTEPFPFGFLWNDFIVDPLEMSCAIPSRGIGCNKEFTHALLNAASTEKCRLVGVIRAHQHKASNNDPMMKLLFQCNGCAQLWKEPGCLKVEPGMVITLLLSPDSIMGTPQPGYTGFNYDTCLFLQTAHKLTNWRMWSFNNDIYEKSE